MKALKKLFLTGLLTALAMSTAMSTAVAQAVPQEPINIILSLPPGGLNERINVAVKEELEKNGYKTNLVRFDNCKGLENWVKANPNRPAVFEWVLGTSALAMIDPGHPGGCNVPLTEKTVLTINHQTQFQACSMKPVREAIQQWNNGTGKLGITAAPYINNTIAEQIAANVNKNIQVVNYKGNPALVQAMISKEIDFVGQFANASSVTQAGATCFFTTAGIGKAARNNQISIDDLRKNSPVAGFGYMSVSVGLNVDADKIRPIITNVIDKSPLFVQHFATGADKRGIPAGTTAAQQFELVEGYFKYFKK
jgi:hypothetical protein